MKVSTLVLTISLVLISNFLYCQVNSFDSKNFSRNMIQCYYLVKEYSDISSECSISMRDEIISIATWIKTQIDSNTKILNEKIGINDTEELSRFAIKCKKVLLFEDATAKQIREYITWTVYCESVIIRIFIKLNHS